MPQDPPARHTLTVRPQPADIDGLQHTNNAVYVQWCEKIAWAHSEALGLGLADYQRMERAMAIRRAEYDYLLPSVLGDEMRLATWLPASGGQLTMERHFELTRATPDGSRETVMRGRWALVCIELSSGRPRRMPAEFARVYLAAATGP